ncbi:DUF4397 domain-containing protein [Usitatibacter palustris]|uniref:DUF4397 domain-containing protein n=1 Tax=Usitatibacter palustris TaxID=2732487 RepID=A0A6M4H5Y3_9PROT|nr:DUF4397 domain-containing protein [Usitatibacter palustris]QJR14595.1 hypothetical protein DSM104440_01397 [Usitatibacter palustris]
MKKFGWLGLVVVACALLAACSNEGRNQNSADLRVVHAVPGLDAIDVLVNDDPKASGVTYTNISEFTNFKAGSRNVKVRTSANGTVIVERDLAFIDGTRTTMLVVGFPNAVATLQLLDDYFSPRNNKIAVRLASATINLLPVDLYFGTSADISNATPLIGGVGFGNTSQYIEMDEGTYTVILTESGTKNIMFQAAPRAFGGGSENTIVSFPANGGGLTNAMLLTMDGGTFVANPLARVKYANAILGSTLNFRANGVAFANDTVYTSVATSYTTVASGARTLTIESSNVPGTSIATLAKTLDAAGDFTVVAVNTLAAPELVVFTDANIFPATTVANVRYANVLPSAAAVDVVVNTESKATNLAFKSATVTTPITLAADTTYTFTFKRAGTETVIATLAGVALEPAAVYTVWLFGPDSGPIIRVVRDR